MKSTSRQAGSPEQQPAVAPAPHRRSFYASLDSTTSWYVLGLLTLSYALAYVDRQLLNLLVDPIKHALSISDTQLSLLQGTAFVSAYLIAAPIFGRLADVTNRRNVLIFGICLWCSCTALCGHANTYLELFAARVGVGASEACVFPVCCSLIWDYFSTKRAPRAISIFNAGQFIGAGFSLVASGLVLYFANGIRRSIPLFQDYSTWQIAFVLVGLAGLILALVLLTVREPTRSVTLSNSVDGKSFTFAEGARYIWRRRAFYGRMYLGIGMHAIVTLGTPAWLPSFLIRCRGVPPSIVGYRLGMIAVLVGTTGVLLGPFVVRFFERRGFADAALRIAGFSEISVFISCVSIPFAPGATGVFIAAGVAIFFFSFPVSIFAAATQMITPGRLRGFVASLHTFIAQSIGFGVGPTAIALLTDKVFGDAQMVGYSMAIVSGTASAIAACLFLSALPRFRAMLRERKVEVT
ncbi:MFS transporter [Caballeronia novacaledonica]|uniref:MFS transporter n=1 Tax=Caballeronia novacaledonica TaxID=1544861 RepID=A0AA37IDB4_9BURK|nr:MFS transporter [Caballeronia novacaledonica]GJH27067.1 MFS transporter [Caballeronia novacaledonica]